MTSDSIAAAQINRATLFVEDGELLATASWPSEQFVMRIRAANCAARASAGSFVHIQCNPHIAMRRPLSIMRVDADAGWLDILFKIVGPGLRALSESRVGDTLSLIGPVGNGFTPDSARRNALLIGGGVGIPPMIYLAEQLRATGSDWNPIVLMGSEIPFPFDLAESSISTPWLAASTRRTLAELETQNICARLASLAGYEGCHQGYVTDLARQYLDSLSDEDRNATAIYSCGPTPMLRAVAAVAAEFAIPCQVSLEEFMACAVGGCAGCAVPVTTPEGTAMKRVCVDGPVFEAAAVF